MRAPLNHPTIRPASRAPRTLAMIATAGLGLAALGIGPTAAQAAPADGAPRAVSAVAGPGTDVIVRSVDGAHQAAAARAVVAVGGTVLRQLDLIGGVVARVPRSALAALRSAPQVAAVTINSPVQLHSSEWTADRDVGSVYSSNWRSGAYYARQNTDGYGRVVTGTGVGVALIDSGVSPVEGLAGAGKIVNGPDLSFESQVPGLQYRDTYGHGTHLAGIIAGRDPTVSFAVAPKANQFSGVAPGAHVVSVKVAAADGATDVSQVIAAIDWVVQHRNDPGMNIRVLNLSFGTDSSQDARFDPLSHAVEVAWRKGIVVVVAGGNDGVGARLSMPAVNPYIIAVGAADPKGTHDRRDDTVAAFSSRGSAARSVDLVAPGRSVVSLRDTGSYVDAANPVARVGTVGKERFLRGSGSSQSAAFVSGTAALLIQQRPWLTADQVKYLLKGTASPMPMADALGRGAGQLNVWGALRTTGHAAGAARQHHPVSLGTGLLEASRGSAHVADSETGVELTGEQDIFGNPWIGAVWAPRAEAATSWSYGTWNGSAWSGDGWISSSLTGRTWSGRTWSGRTWSGSSWTGRTWSAAVWTAAGWSGRTWSGRTWSGRTWSGRTWSGGVWSNHGWLEEAVAPVAPVTPVTPAETLPDTLTPPLAGA